MLLLEPQLLTRASRLPLENKELSDGPTATHPRSPRNIPTRSLARQGLMRSENNRGWRTIHSLMESSGPPPSKGAPLVQASTDGPTTQIRQQYQTLFETASLGGDSSVRPIPGFALVLVHRRREGLFRNSRPGLAQPEVFIQQRSTSATLQAWAMQPRGVCGGSASKISLMVPRLPSLRWGTKPSRKRRAPARSLGWTFSHASMNGPM